jgi:protein-tyrosine-phosphatase
MAEALFRAQLASEGGSDDWRVDSAGTWAIEGAPATDLARRAMREEGLDIEDHRSKPTSEALIRNYDLILVMERRHWAYLRDEYPEFGNKVHMLAGMVGEDHDVEDPVAGTIETYRETVEELGWMLEEGFDAIQRYAGAPQNE